MKDDSTRIMGLLQLGPLVMLNEDIVLALNVKRA